MTEPGALATLQGVSVSYATPAGRLNVLRKVDLRVEPGQSIALVGPSGSGKTTLLRVLAARLRAEQGAVTLLGRAPAGLDDAALAALRRQIGMVDQGSALIARLDVRENVLAPLAGLPRTPQLTVRVERLLGQLGLAERARARPARLSGGERQRVAIARALAMDPLLLLADEPTGHQDAAGGARLVELLLRHAGEGRALVLATHDLAVAAQCARAYRLHEGQLIPVAIRPASPSAGALQAIDLLAPAPAPQPQEATPPAPQPAAGRAAFDPASLVLALLAAIIAGSGGGILLRDYLAAQRQQAALQADQRAMAQEQAADLRDAGWPQVLHDPEHSGQGRAMAPLLGRRAWTRPLDGPVIASPVLAGGLVYVGGTDGYLHALDARSGRERWRFPLGDELINTTPAVRGALIYTAASGGTFFALDRRSGQPRWSAALGAASSAPPVVAGGLVLVTTGPATVQALDAASGRRRWVAHPPYILDLTFPTEAAPTVRDGTVYVAFAGADVLLALRLRDGYRLWQSAPLGQRLGGSPAVDATTVYVTTALGRVVALDRARHMPRWQRALPPTRAQSLMAAPVRAGPLLLVPDEDGSLYALEAGTGRLRWRLATGGALLAAPAVASNIAYQASTDGWLYAVDWRTGRLRWRLRLGESRGTPALSGGLLFAGSLQAGTQPGTGALIAVR